MKHYYNHKPEGCRKGLVRFLETKWSTIKYDVAKFVGIYKLVLALKESGTLLLNVPEHALELFKVKHLKQQSFVFIRYWTILKDIPHLHKINKD
jgi:hypothetical protein